MLQHDALSCVMLPAVLCPALARWPCVCVRQLTDPNGTVTLFTSSTGGTSNDTLPVLVRLIRGTAGTFWLSLRTFSNQTTGDAECATSIVP
jgi:hypothetical protein